MAPSLPSKSKSKQARPLDTRRSRSRNTTPISAGPTTTSESTPHPPDTTSSSSQSSRPQIEDILDRGGSITNIPSATSLNEMRDTVSREFVMVREKAGENIDRLMREMARIRKDSDEEERRRMIGKVKVSKRDRQQETRDDRREEKGDKKPLAVGAHELARQDGVGVHKDSSSVLSSPISAVPSHHGTATDRPASAGSGSTMEDERQPEPAASVPHFQTFGPDPLLFDDPTVYNIRDLMDDLTEDERKEILCVATYPHNDLIRLTAGKPPDRDFSSAKPTNQVASTTFNNWIEPFIRPLTEEDISFLRERTSRHDYRRIVRARQQNRSPSPNVFAVPRRGSKNYKEIWAEEDNRMAVDSEGNRLPPNEPRGDIEQMTDDVAESDVVSLGPLSSRLLQAMRPERRPPADGANGTDAPNGVHGDNMDLDNGDHAPTINGEIQPASATHFSESSSTAWKSTLPAHTSYKEQDDRILQELRHIGFLSEDGPPEFDEHYDDEISARMRFLQAKLKEIAVKNGAKKRRLLELAQERMAQQEYNTISDDLDNQLNQAYLKRNRNSSKSKKSNVKRPGVAQAVGVATARPVQGIGEPIKGLMERKAKWTDWIGPVVGYGKSSIPEESIFSDEALKPYLEAEMTAWEEDNEIEEEWYTDRAAAYENLQESDSKLEE